MFISQVPQSNAHPIQGDTEALASSDERKPAEIEGFSAVLELLSAALVPINAELPIAVATGKGEPASGKIEPDTGKTGKTLPVALPVTMPGVAGPEISAGAAAETKAKMLFADALQTGGIAGLADRKVDELMRALDGKAALGSGPTNLARAIPSVKQTAADGPLPVSVGHAFQVVKAAMPEAAEAIERVLAGRIAAGATIEKGGDGLAVKLEAKAPAYPLVQTPLPVSAGQTMPEGKAKDEAAVDAAKSIYGLEAETDAPGRPKDKDIAPQDKLRLAASSGRQESREGDDKTSMPRTGAEMQSSFLAASATSPVAATSGPAGKAAEVVQLGGTQRFEELVQAISNARETGSVQPVKATLSHAEFGVVALRLSRDDGGISAVISSADPGFGNAAHSAVRALGDAGASSGRNDEHGRPQHSGDQAGQAASSHSQQSAGHDQRSHPGSKSERQDLQRAANSSSGEKGGQVRDSKDDGIYA